MLNKDVTYDIKRKPNFSELLPDFKRFAARKISARKALTQVNHDGTYINATDSHRAIRLRGDIINNEEAPEGPYNYDIHNDEYLAPDFPKMDRLFPDDYELELFLPFDKLKELRDAIEVTSKQARECDYSSRDGYPIIHIELENGILTIMTKKERKDRDQVGYDPIKQTIDVSLHTDESATMNLYANGRYMIEALTTVSKMRRYANVGGFYIRYNSHMRPISITDKVYYDMLVLPVRTF